MFITARFSAENETVSFNEYREKFIKIFSGHARPRLSVARRLIND